MSEFTLIIGGSAIAGLLILFVLLRMLWRVAEPNEAMIISGLGARAKQGIAEDSMAFKIVTGKGVLVLPGFQTARRLSLDTRSSEIVVSCVALRLSLPVALRVMLPVAVRLMSLPLFSVIPLESSLRLLPFWSVMVIVRVEADLPSAGMPVNIEVPHGFRPMSQSRCAHMKP